MSIKRLIVAVLIMSAMTFPKVTLASDTINSDTNIKNEATVIYSLFPSQLAMADGPFVFPKTVEKVVKTKEEIHYDSILNSWKEKQADKWANLPKESFIINASAYTASADECGNSKGVTASGIKVKEDRTIACPPQFPFGLKLRIEGQGTFTCEDRGGAIKGNHIDIYVKTKAEAFAFGRRNLMATIVD